MMNDEQFDKALAELNSLDSSHLAKTTGLRNEIRLGKVLQRRSSFELIFELHLQKMLDPGIQDNVHLNTTVLHNTLDNYFKDVERTREFHGYDYVNRPKKAAYTIKWLIKRLPIYWDHTKKYDDGDLAALNLINHYYAVACGCMAARIEINEIEEKYLKEVIYNLAFRSVRADSLILWFELYFAANNIPTFDEG